MRVRYRRGIAVQRVYPAVAKLPSEVLVIGIDMSLISFQWSPSQRQLRQFGAMSAFALPVVGWLSGMNSAVLAMLLFASSLILLLVWLKPTTLRPLFVLLMMVTTPIGMLVGEISLVLIYLGIFLPLGLAFRLLKRDALQLSLDRKASTYWQAKVQPKSVSHYYRRY